MIPTLKIATIQYDILWENSKGNLTRLSNLLAKINEEVDVIVLPEMFNTGFSMNPAQVALTNGGEAKEWMIAKASELNSCMVGSIATEENGSYFNRLYWAFPDGKIQTYNKRHLFRMASEHQVYKEGKVQTVVEYKGFNFSLQVCYDLRFPVWSRRTTKNDYDCLIYVANWPAVRSDAWYSLLKARAIENLSYVVGVNRVGVDGNKNEYDGKSVVFDFKGTSIDSHVIGKEGISIQKLVKNDLDDFRTKFPADLDADSFIVNV